MQIYAKLINPIIGQEWISSIEDKTYYLDVSDDQVFDSSWESIYWHKNL